MSEGRGVALVTGGSRCIGLGICRTLAEAGFDLAVNGRRAQADVADVLAELGSTGRRVFYCQADISSADDRAVMLARIEETLGPLDVLVNNAGIAPPERADILQASPASFEKVMTVNLQGPYFLTQAVANAMIGRGEAPRRRCIINVGSISATVASTNRGEYCLSKAALAMATQLWATRLAEFGIDVYEVRPGIIETDMTSGVKEKYDAMLAEGLTLEPRWGQPDDIGRAVAILAAGELTYATGQVLVIDGGLTQRRL
jgi:3-oxoacyl-[acyl-carrier protein] reductase